MANSFFEDVHRTVSMIPPGSVATYGQIATYLGNRRAARAVGWALRALPEGSDVPWHRVVNAQGRISTATTLQRVLLEEEGITFDETGQIELRKYLWEEPR